MRMPRHSQQVNNEKSISSIILTDSLLWLRVIIKKVLEVIKISEIVTKVLLKKY